MNYIFGDVIIGCLKFGAMQAFQSSPQRMTTILLDLFIVLKLSRIDSVSGRETGGQWVVVLFSFLGWEETESTCYFDHQLAYYTSLA
jgi:hypothetical protein